MQKNMYIYVYIYIYIYVCNMDIHVAHGFGPCLALES